MCGIICALDLSREEGSSPLVDVHHRLQAQIGRGSKGFGLLRFEPKKPVELLRSTELNFILVPLHVSRTKGLLLHHREPTSSPNRLDQTHPIVCRDEEFEYDYYVVHNGVIYNKDEVKRAHEKMNIGYTTEYAPEIPGGYRNDGFNDSECVAWEVAILAELGNKMKGKVMRCAGSNAFMAVQADRKTGHPVAVLWGRNSRNPLRLHQGGGNSFFWSSAGSGTEAPEHTMFRLDLATRKIRRWKIGIPESVTDAPDDVQIEMKRTRSLPAYASGTGYASEPSGKSLLKKCAIFGCGMMTGRPDGLCYECFQATQRNLRSKEKKADVTEVTTAKRTGTEPKNLPSKGNEVKIGQKDGPKGKKGQEEEEPEAVQAMMEEELENILLPFEQAKDELTNEVESLVDAMAEHAIGDIILDFELEKSKSLHFLEMKLDLLHDRYTQSASIAATRSAIAGEA